MNKQIIAWSLIVLSLALTQSCAPVFSELQSARTVGENNFEVTPSGSLISFKRDGDEEQVQNHLGIQIAYGITPKFDIRLRYERLWLYGDGFFGYGYDVIGIAPKYSILKDRIAISVLLGTLLAEGGNEHWHLHPTMLFSIPLLEDKIDLNEAINLTMSN